MLSKLIVLIALIFVNAFFAATEIAFISINDAKISKKASEGDKKAGQIQKMMKDPSRFLATIQIGITLAGFLSSAFASEAFASKLAPTLNDLIPINLEFWTNTSIIIITIILSYFSLVFGELVPKRIAMKYSEKVAYMSIGFVRFLSIVTGPFVKFLTKSTNIISNIFGVKENEVEVVTEDDIKVMVDAGEENGTIEENEKELINNVFEFNDKVVSEIMVHRKEIFALEINTNLDDIIKEIDKFKYKYSRIPIYEETIDDIKGILYIKDLLKYVASGKNVKIKDIMKEATFVSENKMINELFKEFQKNKKQAAIVVDEYGGTSGFVAMEDIVEEIVGNIFDEYDEIENDFEKIDENTYRVKGNMPIYELEKIFNVKIPDGDYDTVSGYLIDKLGRIPGNREKPIVDTETLTFKIEKCEENRVLRVKVCKNNIIETEE